MKFRVETWDTTERCGTWVLRYSGDDREVAQSEYDWFIRWSPVTDRVRLSQKKWNGWTTVEAAGQYYEETKPMSTSGWTKHDCGCADYRCQWHTTQAWAKKEKPMSTKQRGDEEETPAIRRGMVSKNVAPETWRIHLGVSSANVTRDEFRRIWEAGNAEFGVAQTTWSHDPCAEINGLRQMLRDKDAEIARLKAAITTPKREQELWTEITRLRGWLETIDTWTGRSSLVKRALAGEKVPE